MTGEQSRQGPVDEIGPLQKGLGQLFANAAQRFARRHGAIVGRAGGRFKAGAARLGRSVSAAGGLLAVVLALVAAPETRALDTPLKTLREFCRADGLAMRLHDRGWATVAPLVEWPLEPAWDRVLLIRGYEVGAPIYGAASATIDVTYTLSAEIVPGEVRRGERLETRTFRLAPDPSGRWWRLVGPPPPPHVFESQVEARDLAATLEPAADLFLTSSGFVWKMLLSSGWSLPYLGTRELVEASVLSRVREPAPGDLVFYMDGTTAYHVGFLEAEGTVVSATLSGGLRRTSVEAFPGEQRYMRLTGNASPSAGASPAPTQEATAATQAPTPAAEEGTGNRE